MGNFLSRCLFDAAVVAAQFPFGEISGANKRMANRKRENEAVLRELMRIALKFVFLLHLKKKEDRFN